MLKRPIAIILLGLMAWPVQVVSAEPTAPPVVDRDKAKAELKRIAAEANLLSRAFNLVHEVVGPSVVSIHTKGTVRVADWYTGRVARREIDVGEGSGFVIKSDEKASWVLTNSHVVLQTNQQQEFVRGANGQPVGYDKVLVKLNDGREAEGEYVGFYTNSDLAVLKIAIPHLPPIEWSDSDQVKVGDWVVALGYPLAVGYSATTGIISATDRSTGIYGQYGFDNFIQTDAAINPGNSGGPLVDLQGRVLGVNSNIISRTGSNIGLGFAIPSNHARRITEDLIKYGRVHRSVIGVQYDEQNQERTTITAVVPASPAAKAGLKAGDVVVAVDQYRVTGPQQFQSRMSTYRIGDQVALRILRSGKELVLTVAPVSEDDLTRQLESAAGETSARQAMLANLGMTVAEDGRAGLVITATDPDGIAAAAKLTKGDRLLHEKSFGALRTIDDARQLDRRRELVVQVAKDGRNFWLRLRL